MPKLIEKNISIEKLIPDPNNPRLMSGNEKPIPAKDAANANCVSRTYDRMKKVEFKIGELVESIKENGWIPVDNIFVQKIPGQDAYLVLEGNRRLTALQAIYSDDDIPKDKKISSVAVIVVDREKDESLEEYNDYISTLLGMRHHGSLIKWTAFAQAKNIFSHYCKAGEYTAESFVWNLETAQKIADSLSIAVLKDQVSVQSRLLVYRAMQQTHDYVMALPEVPKSAGVKDKHYSLFSDLLVRGNKNLKAFIKQDKQTFLLDEDALKRMVALCHFDKADREDAPIRSPQEWSPLGKILADTQKEALLARVLNDKELPSDVWSEIQAQRKKWQWDNWLREVIEILKIPDITTDYSFPQIKEAFRRLDAVLSQLK